jgi:toxin ParE1/3/4
VTVRVVWDDEALDDLDSIGAFIANDNPRAARRVVERIRERSQLLETSPRLGKPIVERPGARELILSRYPYVLVYEIEDDEVHILAVFHQSQDRV